MPYPLRKRHSVARLMLAVVALSLAVLICGCESFDRQDPPPYEHLYVVEEFNLDTLDDTWTVRTPDLWHIAAEGDRRFLQMKPPPQRPMTAGVGRPQEYAIYNKYQFRSFNLSCRVRIDSDPNLTGRDACIIFGRRDPTHLYYIHLSNESSGFQNTIVRVDGGTRQPLLPSLLPAKPAITDGQWHKVDVIRDADTGLIQVFVDAFEPGAKPLFETRDKTYKWGRIALGSFNDHASFDHLLIEGQAQP